MSYKELVENPISCCKRLYTELKEKGIEGLRMPKDEEILSFVDPSLNRSKSGSSVKDVLSDSQQKLFEALENKSVELWNEEDIASLQRDVNKN
jgi:hypothetical protein